MPRYEIRRKIEEVITVEADNSEDALAVAQETDNEDWEVVGDEHVSTTELVRCFACSQEIEKDLAARLPDGRWRGKPNQCGCGVSLD